MCSVGKLGLLSPHIIEMLKEQKRQGYAISTFEVNLYPHITPKTLGLNKRGCQQLGRRKLGWTASAESHGTKDFRSDLTEIFTVTPSRPLNAQKELRGQRKISGTRARRDFGEGRTFGQLSSWVLMFSATCWEVCNGVAFLYTLRSGSSSSGSSSLRGFFV